MTKPENDADIRATLKHHDQQLGSLTTEVNGIKGVLRQHGDILVDIRTALSEQKGAKGPNLKEILHTAAYGGGIISMASAAITFLVLSISAPAVTKLETQGAARQAVIERIEAERQDEIKELRRVAAAKAEERIRSLEEKLAWVARTDDATPRKAR